jgi:hypothetical protein
MYRSNLINIDYYTKVERHSQFLRQWSWTIRSAATDAVCERSQSAFKSAEDAWQASQKALANFKLTQVACAA